MNLESKKRLEDKISRELGELRQYLAEDSIVEIMRNPNGNIMVERGGACGGGIIKTQVKISDDEAMLLMSSIATYNGTFLNRKNPLLKATMPWGQRFQGMIEPIVTSPAFTIRCPRSYSLTLDNYVPQRMSKHNAERLRAAIINRENMLISGGTGSGKTTLTAALLKELVTICPEDRITIMEDTKELKIESDNIVDELTSEEVSMSDLLAANLRMRPDRIILGETRGNDSYDLLKSWNTGHPGGICTIHANSGKSALSRLETLILGAESTKNLTITAVRSAIAEAVNIVVHMQKTHTGPKLAEMVIVKGLELNGDYRFESII